ncbi:MAG: hypothetical protein QMD77_02055 [Patescibacteria group bacterium]|nr:hypothetical protein [Patescibacteria group bacterium]
MKEKKFFFFIGVVGAVGFFLSVATIAILRNTGYLVREGPLHNLLGGIIVLFMLMLSVGIGGRFRKSKK